MTMTWSRRVLLASGITAALGLTACSAGASPPASGGGPPPPAAVTLTLGVADSPGNSPPEFQDIAYFTRQVRQLSGGRMKIRILWEVAPVTNPEPATVSLVRDGQVDLGWVGARAWDTLGVRSFQALQAPFLIDSYPLLDAAVKSPMATRMLAGLHQAGFTGLGLYPDQLRHLIGFRKPLASLRDLRAARIRVPVSRASDALLGALGAVPVHLNGSAFSDAITSGTVDGVDAGVAGAAMFGGEFLTGNITSYAKTNTLFADAGRFARLTASQRQVLRSAARRTFTFALATPPEPGGLAAFCAGGRVVTASRTAVDALGRAARPVYAELERDPRTNAFIQQIQQMKQQFPAPVSLAACRP
jgi:TRAP-type C4-dicarboxylate transport system substrate-binding protein